MHEAILTSGERVAVKVQHRWIKEQIPGDIKLTKLGSTCAKRLFKDNYKLGWLVEQMEQKLPQELDFRREAENCNRTRANFQQNQSVCIPQVFYASHRVLVMSFEEGIPINKVTSLRNNQIDLKTVANLVNHAFAEMIFQHGFVHADPHPGNLLVRKGLGGSHELVVLDHGVYTELKGDTRLSYTELWRAMLTQNND